MLDASTVQSLVTVVVLVLTLVGLILKILGLESDTQHQILNPLVDLITKLSTGERVTAVDILALVREKPSNNPPKE